MGKGAPKLQKPRLGLHFSKLEKLPPPFLRRSSAVVGLLEACWKHLLLGSHRQPTFLHTPAPRPSSTGSAANRPLRNQVTTIQTTSILRPPHQKSTPNQLVSSRLSTLLSRCRLAEKIACVSLETFFLGLVRTVSLLLQRWLVAVPLLFLSPRIEFLPTAKKRE